MKELRFTSKEDFLAAVERGEMKDVEVLYCSGIGLTELPELPNVQTLYCGHNPYHDRLSVTHGDYTGVCFNAGSCVKIAVWCSVFTKDEAIAEIRRRFSPDDQPGYIAAVEEAFKKYEEYATSKNQ